MKLKQKLAILADAAKYDASCASSGSVKRDSSDGRGVGSTSGGMGICHSYAPDGRCISLLKVLLTNFCIYDCSYCINRASSPIERARFSVEEVVNLTLDFYKRNYIEGLFLSSGIIQSSDYTMEQLVLVAKTLRVKHDFRGYIHLKTIPDASPELLRAAGIYADRLSINIELPSKRALQELAPEKNPKTIHQSMGTLQDHINEAKEHKADKKIRSRRKKKAKFDYSPAGQSTQLIVGADPSTVAKILTLSNGLYQRYHMRRVYYSAFSPIPHSNQQLPSMAPPLMREHRLYQADWLLRFYGFNVNEITPFSNTPGSGSNQPDGSQMLDLDIDPKLAWAIRNRDLFPVNINTASKDMILRIPGVGVRGCQKILQARQFRQLRIGDLPRCGLSAKKVGPFIETADYNPHNKLLTAANLKAHFVQPKQAQQLSLF